jgi:hypothetical protein
VGGKAVPVGTKKEFGPYKGSKQNGGRPIKVTKVKGKDGKWHTTSKNKARDDYEKKNGKLPRDVDVDHKNNNHSDDRSSNLRPLKHGKNTAKENKRRAGKK